MDDSTYAEVQQWLLKAEHDLQSAVLLLNNHGLCEMQVFIIASKLLRSF